MGRAFQVLSRRDKTVRGEIKSWEPGFVLCMKASFNGPSVTLARGDDGIRMIKSSGRPRADMTVTFRSIDAAFLVLSGRIGVAQAYAQHRFLLSGSIFDCMTLVHCVDVIEGYLFPRFIAGKILKRFPQKECSTVFVYCQALLGG
ncbi:hypothetical protein [Caproicibacter fermentans]|nr:hypothetical protein [Caproicibacter fermentans]